MKQAVRWCVAAVSCVLLWLAVSPAPARAFTILVNDPVDQVLINGVCSLREAILSLNAGAPNPDCVVPGINPFGVLDTILLGVNTGAAIPGPLENASATGDYDITVPMTIIPAPMVIPPCPFMPAAPPPCVAGLLLPPGDRAFDVLALNVVFQNISVVMGNVGLIGENGGAIRVNAGAGLTLNAVNVVRSFAVDGGGVHNAGVLAVTNNTAIWGNTAQNNGGGVANGAGATAGMLKSQIMANGATNRGGGVHNDGALTMDAMLVYQNTSLADGGGVYNGKSAQLFGGSLVRDNAAGAGGGIANAQYLTLTDTQVYSNVAATHGGGISNTGEALISATLVTTNAAGLTFFGGGIYNNAGKVVAENSSVLTNTADMGGGIYNTNGSTLRMISSTIDLNRAAADGGGLHNALSTVEFTAVGVRGNEANNGAGVWNAGTFSGSTTLLDKNTAVVDGGGAWNALTGTITLTNQSRAEQNMATRGGGLYNEGGIYVYDSRLTNNIAGCGGGEYQYDGLSRLVRSDVVNNAAIGPLCPGDGGGVHMAGRLDMDAVRLAGNTAMANGGGIFVQDGLTATVFITDSWLELNVAVAGAGGGVRNGLLASTWITNSRVHTNVAQLGGGLWVFGRMSVISTSLAANIASFNGGGIEAIGGPMTTTLIVADDSSLTRNQANNGVGGGIRAVGPVKLVMRDIMLAENFAGFDGGGLHTDVMIPIEIVQLNLVGNFAGLDGGGWWLRSPHFGMWDVRLDRNMAIGGNGGGLALMDSNLTLSRTVFLSNTTNGHGGGMWVQGSVSLTHRVDITANVAGLNGGGIHLEPGATAVVSGTRMAANTASGHGGGLFGATVSGSLPMRVSILGSAVVSNSAGGNGGGLHLGGRPVSVSLDIAGTDIVSNTAGNHGGGVYVQGRVNGGFVHVPLTDNRAGQSGGGFMVDSFFDVFYSVELNGISTMQSSRIARNIAIRGGGVFNTGALTITQGSVITGNGALNQGGGIANDVTGTIMLSNTLVYTNVANTGGGASNRGRMIVDAGAWTHNRSFNNGGAIFNQGRLQLVNATLSANTASNSGGAIINWTQAGLTGTLAMTNVTLAGNTATGGGGLFILVAANQQSALNTLFANNVPNNCTGSGTIASLGYNLDSGNSCGLGATGDLTNTAPMIGPLAFNAPGSTPTHALLLGSPAVNGGTNTGCPATDQRGVGRPIGARCDIGAYETATIPRVYMPSTRRDAVDAW